MTAVVAVCEREIDALIESLLHCTAHERADGLAVIADGILDILDLAAVAQIPETPLKAAQALGRRTVDRIQVAVLVLELLDLIVDVLERFECKRTVLSK